MDDKKIDKNVDNFMHQKYVRVLLSIDSVLFYVTLILAILKLVGLVLVTWGSLVLLSVVFLALLLVVLVLGFRYFIKQN